jgi:hypothetical protein
MHKQPFVLGSAIRMMRILSLLGRAGHKILILLLVTVALVLESTIYDVMSYN